MTAKVAQTLAASDFLDLAKVTFHSRPRTCVLAITWKDSLSSSPPSFKREREGAHRFVDGSRFGGRSYWTRGRVACFRTSTEFTKDTEMQCQTRDEIEQHLSDVRTLATRIDLTNEERGAVVRAERFTIELLREHDAAGHNGKGCPLATQF